MMPFNQAMMLRILQGLTILYVIVLTILLEIPLDTPEMNPAGETVKGYAHLITFSLLGFLVELCRRKRSLFFWISVLFLYALGTEVLQWLLHPLCNRYFDWNDIFQNVLGVLLGTFVGYYCRLFVSRQRSESRSSG